MPVIFYIFGGLALFGALINAVALQFTLAATILTSAVFCLGFGYMIDLLEQIRNNTKPLIESRLARELEVPAGYEDTYKGYPFKRLDGGQVEVLITGKGTRVFKSWKEFSAAVGG